MEFETTLILPDGTTTLMESLGSAQLETYQRWLEDVLVADIPPAMRLRILETWLTETHGAVRAYLRYQNHYNANRASNNTHFMNAMDTLRKGK